jgi:hypothetical protein
MTSRMSSSSRECQWISVDILSTLPGLKEFIRQTPVPTWFICLRKKFTWIRTKKTERDRRREAKRCGEKEVISSEVKEKMRLQWAYWGAELERLQATPNSTVHITYVYYRVPVSVITRPRPFVLETWTGHGLDMDCTCHITLHKSLHILGRLQTEPEDNKDRLCEIKVTLINGSSVGAFCIHSVRRPLVSPHLPRLSVCPHGAGRFPQAGTQQTRP